LYPVLFRLGSFVVTGYAALVGLGLIAGVVIACLNAQRRGINAARVLDASLAAALGGLIGGRAVYAVAHWDYCSDNLNQALRLWGGGLAWHGALVGGLLATLAYCAVRHESARVMLDVLTPGVALLAVCAWLGCLLNGCAYGLETYAGQGWLWALSLELPDLYGIWLPRVAVQLLGAGWSMVVLVAVVIARRCMRNQGLLFPLWLGLYAIGCLGLGFLRADETLFVGGWRVDQVADLVLAIAGVGLVTVQQRA
jgi:phosphatidylglycerol:prolipoprotein diacylglycerol transferase